LNDEKTKSATLKSNKFVGPGLGLIIMGVAYLVWWLIYIEDAIDGPIILLMHLLLQM
jgi:hypothetical protein